MTDPLAELLRIESMIGVGAGAVFGGIVVLAIAESVRNQSKRISALWAFRRQGFTELDEVELGDEIATIEKLSIHEARFRMAKLSSNGKVRYRTVDNLKLSGLNICRLKAKSNGYDGEDG